MKLFKLKGIVIKEIQYKENDKIITLLTDKFGKISCFAKGAKKTNSPLMASCQLFVYSEFVLYKGTSFYHINSSEIINTFYNLRDSLDKIDYVYEITNILNTFIYENQESKDILQLYLNAIHLIANKDISNVFLLAVFKLKLLKLAGFLPSFSVCGKCKKKLLEKTTTKQKNYTYSNVSNHILCLKCTKDRIGIINISEAVFLAINYVENVDIKKVFMFKLSEQALKEFNSFVNMIYKNLITF